MSRARDCSRPYCPEHRHGKWYTDRTCRLGLPNELLMSDAKSAPMVLSSIIPKRHRKCRAQESRGPDISTQALHSWSCRRCGCCKRLGVANFSHGLICFSFLARLAHGGWWSRATRRASPNLDEIRANVCWRANLKMR
jgi:hypothetical protein